jgi:hypothetical protein
VGADEREAAHALGKSSANCCEIIPPIEKPTTWALGSPAASSTAAMSAAMEETRCTTKCGTTVCPEPRLSSRITRCERARRRAMRNHIAELQPSPITSTTGSPWPSAVPEDARAVARDESHARASVHLRDELGVEVAVEGLRAASLPMPLSLMPPKGVSASAMPESG